MNSRPRGWQKESSWYSCATFRIDLDSGINAPTTPSSITPPSPDLDRRKARSGES